MKKGKFFKKAALAATICLTLSQSVWAMPSGGKVESGNITGFSANPTSGATFAANGASIINWNAFGIAAGEKMTFNTVNGALLNRVIGSNISEIFGTLNQVGGNPMFLVNPNGILVGKGAVINANNMVLSTLEIASSNFLNGNYTFTTPNGKDIAAPIKIKSAKINNSPMVSASEDEYGNQYQEIQGNGNFTVIGGTIEISDGVTFDIGTSSNLQLYAANEAKASEYGKLDTTNTQKNIVTFSNSALLSNGAFDILGGTVNINDSKLYYFDRPTIQSYNHDWRNNIYTSTGTVTIKNSKLFSTSEYGWIQIMGESVKISGSTIDDPYPTIYAVQTKKDHPYPDPDDIMFDFEMMPNNRISLSNNSSLNGRFEVTLISGTISVANNSTINTTGDNLFVVASTAATKKMFSGYDYEYSATGAPGIIAVSEDSKIIQKGVDVTNKIATTRVVPDEDPDPSDVIPIGKDDKENIANGKTAMESVFAKANNKEALITATRELIQGVNKEAVTNRAKAAQVSGILLAIQENKTLSNKEKIALQNEVSQTFTPTQTANSEGNSTTDSAAQLGTTAATGNSQPKDTNATVPAEETSNIEGL